MCAGCEAGGQVTRHAVDLLRLKAHCFEDILALKSHQNQIKQQRDLFDCDVAQICSFKNEGNVVHYA